MKNKNIFSYLFSTRLMTIAILAFAFAMAVATFIENDYGTSTAKALIYNAKWFELIMLILVINFIGNVFKYRLYRKEKWPVFLFHIAFVITLIGAFITRYYSFEGTMQIREGKVSSTIYSDKTYIQTRVDNSKVMKNYEEAVLFGQIGSNNYSLAEKFGEGENKIPFSIELVNFVAKAKEILVEDPKGDSYLHIVESSEGSRNDFFLKEGEIKNINNILFTYNSTIDGGINIFEDKGKPYIKSVFNGTYMEMKTQKLTAVSQDSVSALQVKKLYTFDNLRFVIAKIAKGKVISETAPKAEQKTYPYDALTLKVASGNDEKIINVKGASGAILQPKKITMNGLNFYILYGSKELKAPFSLKLRDFELERYPGTKSASSYASEVTVITKEKTFDYRIYMNNVLDYNGYRFFQSSFDPDEKGTVLSVNHDYWGTLITYIGYVLMGIGMFFSLFLKGSRFKDISKKLKKLSNKKAASLGILLVLFSLSSFAQEKDNHEGHNHAKGAHPQEQVQQEEKYEGHNHTVQKKQQENQKEHNHDTPISRKEVSEEELQKRAVSREHADKFGRLLIQDHQGRIKPINTYALESLRKIYKKDNYKGLNAEQVLLTAQLNPRLFSFEPIIKAGSATMLGSKIVTDLSIKEEHTNMISFFGKKGYYLEELVAESLRKKKSLRNASDNEIIKLDEKANIWYSLLEGNLMKIYPKEGDTNNKWFTGIDKQNFVGKDTMVLFIHDKYMYSLTNAIKTGNYKEADGYLKIIADYQHKLASDIIPAALKIDLEIKYNRYKIFFKLMMFYSLIGMLLLILTFVDLFKPNNKKTQILLQVFIGVTIVALLAHTIGIGVRWYVSGHAPWSNSYEATVFISWVLVIAGLLFTRNKSKFIISAAVLFTGFLLGIAHGNLMNPEMTNLVPVLKSYWLMIHVAIITASYAFLGLGSFLGFFVLLLFLIRTPENRNKLKDTIKELSYINEMTITIGLYMLSIGTFLGGVWANESWGRYWSWDPKEVWALISMMIYIFILHMRLVPGLKSKFAFNFMSMISIATLIMTYLGVNYYLAGMHSYGKGDPVPIPNWIYYFVGFIFVFSILSYRKYKKLEK